MQRGLAVILTALFVAGCARPPSSSTRTADATAISPTEAATITPRAQPFNLFTHCGILTTYFADRIFYLAELDPSRVHFSGSPGSPEVAGTMTLLSPHVAVFVDPAGDRIVFVDELPGVLNTPYPFAVHVMSGGNQPGDEQFAGRRWRTTETLPGVAGPPYGTGMDRFTSVSGTFTLIDSQHAIFRSDAGANLHYLALPPAGCD